MTLYKQSEHQDPIRELTKVSPRPHVEFVTLTSAAAQVCLINNITVIVAWRYAVYSHCMHSTLISLSPEEAGAYLSTFKQFEHRPPDMIKERVDNDYTSILRTALTSISKVNKTDVETLRTSFGVSYPSSIFPCDL